MVQDFIHQQYECVQPVPFHKMSDLQLGDQKATLNHLVDVTFTIEFKPIIHWFIVDELVQFHRSFGYIWISEKKTAIGGGFTYVYFHPYLGKWSNLTHIFRMGWFNHQTNSAFWTFRRLCSWSLPDTIGCLRKAAAKNRTNKSWARNKTIKSPYTKPYKVGPTKNQL